MDITELLERFLAHIERQGRSAHTIAQRRRHVLTFADWAREVRQSGDVSELSEDDVARFLTSPRARTSARGGEKKASSVNCVRTSVRAFLRYVHQSAGVVRERGTVPQRNGPRNAITVATYAELDQYVGAFAHRHLNLLILIGAPGLQKTKAIRSAVGGGACWIEGQATAFGIYRRLWETRNRLVVIDDVDGLYASRDGLRLLKSLCQTELVKRVSWHSDAPTLRREGIPREFTTTSRVAIIANEWRTLDRNVGAVEDRGICVVFEPSAIEIHRQTGKWFWDQEIFDFVGKRLRLFPALSMRLYSQLWVLKTAGINWRSFALERAVKGVDRASSEKPPKIVLNASAPQKPPEEFPKICGTSRFRPRRGDWENN